MQHEYLWYIKPPPSLYMYMFLCYSSTVYMYKCPILIVFFASGCLMQHEYLWYTMPSPSLYMYMFLRYSSKVYMYKCPILIVFRKWLLNATRIFVIHKAATVFIHIHVSPLFIFSIHVHVSGFYCFLKSGCLMQNEYMWYTKPPPSLYMYMFLRDSFTVYMYKFPVL